MPSEYNAEIAAAICAALAEGQSLRAICQARDMPARSSVFNWLAANDEFREQYARARAAQAEHYIDEILEIADDTSGDTHSSSKTGVNALSGSSKTGVNALSGSSKTGMNALSGSSKTGVNALSGPSKTGVNALRATERGERHNSEGVARAKLRIDTRKWLMGKLAPKKYGDRLELGGAVGIRHEDALAELE